MINKDLSTLTHSAVTNLKSGKISNHDAALLIIASSPDGLAKSPEVIKQLQSWRGEQLAFTYLWNTSESGGYGFVGKNVDSVSNKVYHISDSGARSCYTQRRTYWFRVKRGKYSLTLEGYRRLAELQAQLS